MALEYFLAALKQSLERAGIPVTGPTVTMAAQAWTYWQAQNQSRDWFVNLLKTLSSTPQWVQQAGPPPGPGGGGIYQPPPAYPGDGGGSNYPGMTIDPSWPAEQWKQEQAQYLTIEELKAQTLLDIANINDASARYIAELRASLERELQEGRITHEAAMTALELAQRESEFARMLALQTLISDRQYEVATAQLALQERELQARLAANPADWLTYQAFLKGGALSGGGAPGEGAGPMSEEDLKKIAEQLTTPSGALYNPRLAGIGVAGAEVPGPQDVSRFEMYSMSPTEMEMFGGFLRGGIEIDGRRVAINPADWFQQASRGWVPAIGEGAFMPEYA